MKNKFINLVIGSVLLSNIALAQSWKTAGLISAGVSAVISGVSLTTLGNSSNEEPEVGESRTQNNSKANYDQAEDEFFSYLLEYSSAVEAKREFLISDIKQPFIKEIIIKIIKDEKLLTDIENQVIGENLLEKINTVLLAQFEAQ